MKKFLLCVVYVAIVSIGAAQTGAIRQYVDTYGEIAIREMMRTGVPASITLAQGIVESQAGQSDLVKSSNNHFGIKCKEEWTGDCVYHDDDLKNECFRVYNNAEESFRDHSDFLKNRPYYTGLFDINPADYKAWAKGLKKAGYATERDYPQMLIKMIEANGLQQYTLTALARMKGGEASTTSLLGDTGEGKAAPLLLNPVVDNVATPTESHLQNAIDKQREQPSVVTMAGATEQDSDTYPQGVFTINHRKVIYASAGTTLLAIAKKNNIKLALLLQYNELAKQKVLKEDRLIFLQLKPATGEHEYHVATHSETIDEVAQSEGVRLESLLEYNHLRAGAKLAVGKKIYLQPSKRKSPKEVKPSRAVKTSKSSAPHAVSKKKKHKGHKA